MSNIDSTVESQRLKRVNEQLERYSHPLFEWEACSVSSGVEIVIRLRIPDIYEDPYRLRLRPREIDSRGFEWDFQRQLYNCLHDYLVEMFTRSPHITEI